MKNYPVGNELIALSTSFLLTRPEYVTYVSSCDSLSELLAAGEISGSGESLDVEDPADGDLTSVGAGVADGAGT